MSWIITQWKEGFSFFRQEILKVTFIVMIAFFVVAAISWVFLALNTDIMMKAIAYLQNLLAGISEDGVVSAWELFANNIRACAVAVGMGFIPFFFLGMISLVTNAVSIGIVGSMYQYANMSILLLLAGLLPHGIFEFPAIFISLALGLRTCFLMTKRITGKLEALDMKQHFFNVLRVFVMAVIPLLIAAACVEAYITPICMEWFV